MRLSRWTALQFLTTVQDLQTNLFGTGAVQVYNLVGFLWPGRGLKRICGERQRTGRKTGCQSLARRFCHSLGG